MLNILGRPDTRRNHCDGATRRDFIKVGGMLAGGLSLPQLLRAESNQRKGRSHKAIIHIYLPGGPSHIDMFDPKPNAPVEIRGEFSPIKTNVPGIEICELFPRMAAMMDKFAIIRSLADSDGGHDCYQCMTGHRKGPAASMTMKTPAASAWVSKVLGPANNSVPANLSLMYPTGNRTWGEAGTGGFLGAGHAPVGLVGKTAESRSDGMTLQGITLDRLADRRAMLSSLDRYRREIDTTGAMEGLDSFSQQALGILTSSKLVDALDISKEDPRILERYGKNDANFQRDGAPRMIRNFLVARRLVEAGARVVTLNYSRWDWHGGDGMNYPMSREEFPLLDMGLSALVTDLHERGLDKDVSVLMWGEFGRTPKINKSNSRDHWPQANYAVVAGGGMRTGQVIGSTNRYGEHPADRPVMFQEVWATMYRNLGIDPTTERMFDVTGRPQYLVDEGVRPMRELI